MPGRPRIARTAYVFDFRNQPPATAQHDGSPCGKALLRLNLPHFSRREEMECTQYEQANGKERKSCFAAPPEKTPVVSTAATSLCDTLGGLARKKSKKFLELDPDNDPVTPVTIDERADGVFVGCAPDPVLRPGAFVFSGRANCRPEPICGSILLSASSKPADDADRALPNARLAYSTGRGRSRRWRGYCDCAGCRAWVFPQGCRALFRSAGLDVADNPFVVNAPERKPSSVVANRRL